MAAEADGEVAGFEGEGHGQDLVSGCSAAFFMPLAQSRDRIATPAFGTVSRLCETHRLREALRAALRRGDDD